jgi:hypothetical protein
MLAYIALESNFTILYLGKNIRECLAKVLTV